MGLSRRKFTKEFKEEAVRRLGLGDRGGRAGILFNMNEKAGNIWMIDLNDGK
jgi:hypothetical protein